MIRVMGVRHAYGSGNHKVHALNGVDLQIETGEFVSIMGKSGCGKTTLLNILGTLEIPESGSYEIDEKNMLALSEKQRCKLRRKEIAIIYQNYNLVEDLSVMNNIVLPFMFDGTEYDKLLFDRLLSEFGLQDLLFKRASHLSGGEQQRVAILRALLQKPKLILADEPTGNLDSVNSLLVMEALKKGNEELGQTIIMVTHDSEVAGYASRILHMKDGLFERPEAEPCGD